MCRCCLPFDHELRRSGGDGSGAASVVPVVESSGIRDFVTQELSILLFSGFIILHVTD